MRKCCSCDRSFYKDSFSRNQWAKGIGYSRCHGCVNSGNWKQNVTTDQDRLQESSDESIARALERLSIQIQKIKIQKQKQNTPKPVDHTQTARNNNASKASFEQRDLDNPFAQGSFRWVAKGVYTVGDRAGEPCVCKWFKTRGVLEAQFFEKDLDAVRESIRIITEWNRMGFVDKIVKINQPQIWTFTTDTGDFANRKVLQEPFIQKYQKFNSNTGWADDSIPWSRVMQALSHYSYHFTNGECLLCDLQGGVYQNGIVLTDPVIMSRERAFGPTDLGIKGMHTFFATHKCNEFCRGSWKKILQPIKYHTPRKGSTMEHVPTQRNRPKMSVMGAIGEY